MWVLGLCLLLASAVRADKLSPSYPAVPAGAVRAGGGPGAAGADGTHSSKHKYIPFVSPPQVLGLCLLLASAVRADKLSPSYPTVPVGAVLSLCLLAASWAVRADKLSPGYPAAPAGAVGAGGGPGDLTPPGAAGAAPEVIPIVSYSNTPNGGDGSYSYGYETGNGISAQEEGSQKEAPEGPGTAAQGAYSYTGTDGVVYTVVYTADENGFVPKGDHLPTPPPIPAEIQAALEQLAAAEAAEAAAAGAGAVPGTGAAEAAPVGAGVGSPPPAEAAPGAGYPSGPAPGVGYPSGPAPAPEAPPAPPSNYLPPAQPAPAFFFKTIPNYNYNHYNYKQQAIKPYNNKYYNRYFRRY